MLYSADSIGPVAPVLLPASLSVPSVLTITQLLPVAPALVVKLKPSKFDPVCISDDVRPLVVETVPPMVLVPTAAMAGFTVVL